LDGQRFELPLRKLNWKHQVAPFVSISTDTSNRKHLCLLDVSTSHVTQAEQSQLISHYLWCRIFNGNNLQRQQFERTGAMIGS